MKPAPLRWMMLVPILATITLGFAAFAVYLDGVQRENLLADIDEELVRAERSTLTLRTTAEVGPGPGPNSSAADVSSASGDLPDDVAPPVQLIIDADGRIMAEGGSDNPFSDADLIDLATRTATFAIDDPRVRVRATPLSATTVAITALPLEQLDESMSDFRRTLLGGGLIILALEAGVVWLLTAALARPVTRMTATATRIADGAIDTEIDPPSGSRETAALADDLARMVSQLRSMIEDRERSAADATRARDDMRRFLADMSHELRTPLTALKGYSDLYAGNMLEEPGALDRAMGRIGDESERLYGLVNEMLQLAREAPPTEQRELVEAGDIVQLVVDDLRAAHPDLPITYDRAPGTDATVLGLPGRLHQAILNVGSNACHHTAPDAGVQFRIQSDDRQLVINVIDHGPGIDPSEVDKVFLPFYRQDTSRGRDGRGGAGLGLAITLQIMERHHGTAIVGPTPGGGATFTLTVPLPPIDSHQ